MQKVKNIILCIVMFFCSNFIRAEEILYDGIYVWTDGSPNCYRLDKKPTITYADNFVILSVEEKQVLKLSLDKGNRLNVSFGIYDVTYDPSSIKMLDATPTPITKFGKYIRGGKLIIVKDKYKYDINGVIIND